MQHTFPTLTFMDKKGANHFKLNLCLHQWTSISQFWLSEIQNPQQNTRLTALMVWIQPWCWDGGITATQGDTTVREHCMFLRRHQDASSLVCGDRTRCYKPRKDFYWPKPTRPQAQRCHKIKWKTEPKESTYPCIETYITNIRQKLYSTSIQFWWAEVPQQTQLWQR